MTIRILAERLSALTPLTPAENAAFDRFEGKERQLQRGRTLVRENDPGSHIYLITSGMMMSSVLLDDGRRQILDFLFPGDMIGLCTLAYGRVVETVTALGEATVCGFDRSAIATLLVEQPRVAGLIMAIGQIERVALTDRLAGLGRTSAKSRVAALLLELRDRLHRVDPEIADSFVIPVTQEELGDAIGLTAVHVNRMLRKLEEEGLIERAGSRVTLRDRRELARAANYVDRSKLDLSWLPASRTELRR